MSEKTGSDETVMLVLAAPRLGLSEEAFGEWYDAPTSRSGSPICPLSRP